MKNVAISLLLGVMLMIPSVSFADKIIGIDLGVSGPNGVYCEVNEVTLFALNAEDCEKAGGVVKESANPQVEDKASE